MNAQRSMPNAVRIAAMDDLMEEARRLVDQIAIQRRVNLARAAVLAEARERAHERLDASVAALLGVPIEALSDRAPAEDWVFAAAETGVVRILYKQDEDTWVASSPEIPHWTTVADTFPEARRLAEAGVRFALERDDLAIENYVPAKTAVAA
ncbi:MAG TPA: hypothetical protein VID70_08170 [Solirubrobacteraceae bacterium]|jgi:predicted RNase H-like HicB family nuclease